MGTVLGQGTTVWVLMRQRNSSLRRSMASVMRAGFHCDGSRLVTAKNRLPASSRLSATARHFRHHVREKALRRVSISVAVQAQVLSP